MNLVSQSKHRYFFVSVFFTLILFVSKESNAQLIVNMNLTKTNYLSYEPMVATGSYER